MKYERLVGTSSFAKKRHIPNSEFTHFDGTWEELECKVAHQIRIENFKQGYRDGVIIVSFNDFTSTGRFKTYTDFPMFEGMKLEADYRKVVGREYEPPKLCIRILEPKKVCNYVDVILYRKDVLEEDGDRSTNAEWEIVSINGRLKEEEPPMDAMTIVRNWKHLPGGTEMKGRTAEEVLEMLCKSIIYKNGMK